MSVRPVKQISGTQPTMEGAGVHLQRVFGFGDPSLTDPFLLIDDFRNDGPTTICAAFPGIRIAASRPSPMCWPAPSIMATASATAATLGAGDVQWMTAGSASCIRKCRRATRSAACTGSSCGPICPPP